MNHVVMKRIGLNVLFLMLFTLFVNAQESNYRKPVIVVNYFDKSSGFSDGDCEVVRNAVLSSLSGYERLRVVDVETEASIDEETKRRLKEAALADELARSGQMKQLGADYILEGNLTKLETKREKDSKGKITFDGKLTYTVKVVSTEDGTVAYSNNYEASSSSSDTEAEARTEALKKVGVSCALVEAVCPLNGILIDQDYTEKKGKLKTCYINLGAIHGVEAGMYFDVKTSKNVAGRTVYKDVGVIKVESVLADDLSECSVMRHGKEILQAIKQYTMDKTTNEATANPVVISSRCTSGRFIDFSGLF